MIWWILLYIVGVIISFVLLSHRSRYLGDVSLCDSYLYLFVSILSS